MNCLSLLFISTITLVGQVFGEETTSIRVDLDPQQVACYEEGLFFKSHEFGDILLNEVTQDASGYYTTCNIQPFCADCDRLLKSSIQSCDWCGSYELDIAPSTGWQCGDYLTIDEAICLYLEELKMSELSAGASTHFQITPCGRTHVRAKRDTEGNKELSVTVQEQIEIEKNNNKSFKFDITTEGRIHQDRHGKVTGEIKVGLECEY